LAFTPADRYVTPAGIGLYNNLFGEDNPGGPGNFFGGGGLFGENPFQSVKNAWDFQRLGYGVVPASDQLNAASFLATNRYMNFPDQWEQWNATDIVGPDGVTLASPVKMTGLRVGQDYGVNRDPYGNVADPWHSEMFQAGLGVRNNLNSDRWLDPLNALQGLRDVQGSSAYGMPDPGDYLSTMRGAIGGPGAADFYGQRGVSQTNDLADTNLRQLTRGIDREAQETLANRLPEISQAMEAAGLGRSGASQLQMLNAQKDILAQANRDKQRVMADYTDREANRRAQAINLGSQIGAQGYGQYADRMGQGALAGLGDRFTAEQANRQNEQNLFEQMMQNRFAKNQGDQNALFNLLGTAGQYTLGGLDAERMGQSAALQDWLGLQSQRDAQRTLYMDQMLNLSDRQRSIEQDRINQMMQAGFMPLDLITRMTTGISGSNYTPQQSAPWWSGALSGASEGVGEGVGSWFADFFGGKGPK
jgi:hypothetical protein